MIAVLLAQISAFAKFAVIWILATGAMPAIAPYAHDDRAPIAIAFVASSEPPLFEDDADGTRTLAVLLATAREESSMRPDSIGDHGRAFGLFQIWRRPDLMAAIPNVREGLRQIRISFAECPQSPFDLYLSGKCGKSARVSRQSDRRMARVGAVLALLGRADLSGAEARK